MILTRHEKYKTNSDHKIIKNFKIYKKKIHASNKNSSLLPEEFFSRCHKFNNSRINSNQLYNQSIQFIIVIKFLLKKKYHNT
jgi:hypothetical protein